MSRKRSSAKLSVPDRNQSTADIQRSSMIENQHLIKLVKKARTMLKNNDAFGYPEDPDIINLKDLQNILATELESKNNQMTISHQDRIIINISGTRFETFKYTLEAYPNTLLGNPKRRKHYYDAVQNEYFFNRHRQCFEAILYYYQSNGRLRRPNSVPIDTFLEEITFFDLGKDVLAQIRKDENLKEIEKIRLPQNPCRRYLWATLEYPEFSFLAKCLHIFSSIIILLATITLTIETLPEYVNSTNDACQKEYDQYNRTWRNNSIHRTKSEYICRAYFLSPFNLIQTVCVGFFTIELLLRLISMPSLYHFMTSIMNWIDILAVVPFYVTIAFHLNGGQYMEHSSNYLALQLLRVVRFTRVLKFYRIFKNVKAIRVLGVTLRESLPDFFILIVILTLLAFLFGSVVYFVENTSTLSTFDSIPKATYWGIITITSVGYGDIVPTTIIGRILACFCALSGAGTIAMLVSVLVDRYQRVYQRKLYIQGETLDWNEYADEDKHDTESVPLYQNRNESIPNMASKKRCKSAPHIYINRRVAKEHNNELNTMNGQLLSSLLDPIHENNTKFHVMISFDDSENNEISKTILNKIIAIASEKQFTSTNMAINVISNTMLSRSSLSLAGLPNLLIR